MQTLLKENPVYGANRLGVLYRQAIDEPSWNGYTYQLTDHLGNVRAVVKKQNGNTLEVGGATDYYPFGMKHKGYNYVINGTEYKYKTYQGQELNEELGLNWISFKYRNYDSAIARFMSIDPLAEEYAYNSTYAFQENKLGMGVELEGLELSSVRSKDGKSVTLTMKVKPVNNSNILTGNQFNTLVSARAAQTSSSMSGDAGDGVTVTTNVVVVDNATIVWEYNDALNVPDEVGAALGMGFTDPNGNTQENNTQVNVPNNFSFDENGQLEFTDENISTATITGSHEDGHVGGLQHPDKTKNKQLSMQIAKDKTNLMQNSATGTNVLPAQRKALIQKVEEEQPKQN